MPAAPQSRKTKRKKAEGYRQLSRIRRLNKNRALEQLKAMDPIVFEYLVGALFEQQGYRVTNPSASADEGVDLILQKPLKKAVVQCKRYGHSVGQPVVRDLYGTMLHNRAKESYLVTTAIITAQARSWAKGKPIHLVDGYDLVNWIAKSKGFGGINWSRVVIFPAFVAVLLIWGFGFDGFTQVMNWLQNLSASPPANLPISLGEEDYILYFPMIHH